MLAKIAHIYYNICVIPKVEKFCFFVGDFWNFGGIYVYETDARGTLGRNPYVHEG